MQYIQTFLDNPDFYLDILSQHYYYKVISRILVAVILGGIVGYEREHKNRPAGFRTHILVCVSACAVMVLSDLLFAQYYNSYGVMFDPQRLAAQVISGIGFLGAGTIIHFGNSVRGLTTAASIWSVAVLGLIAGSGLFFLAFFTLITIELVLNIFDGISKQKFFKSKTLDLFLTIAHSPEVMGSVTLFFAEQNMNIVEIQFKSFKEPNETNPAELISKVKLVLDVKNSIYSFDNIVDQLQKKDGIISVQY